MAFDSFLDIAGITGESTAKGFEGKVEIVSFSWGGSNAITVGSGTGGMSGGKVSLSCFNLMKRTDKASTDLFQGLCSGKHYATATVTMRKAGGEQLQYLTYKFTDVMVESIQWSGSTGGDDTPVESLSLAYSKVEIEYKPQNANGSLGAPCRGSWDLQKVSK
jgi:type VI secretion system secreted protein Hcp